MQINFYQKTESLKKKMHSYIFNLLCGIMSVASRFHNHHDYYRSSGSLIAVSGGRTCLCISKTRVKQQTCVSSGPLCKVDALNTI